MNTNTRSALPILNVIALVVTLAINFLSQSGSIFGVKLFPYTMAELGESRAIFFLPAGYVFGIWGIIYTGLIAYVVYQARPSQRQNPIINQVGLWFIVSCAGNSVWLLLFMFNQVAASTLAMLAILVALLAIYWRLGTGRTPAAKAAERWLVRLPFSIYLGWITVATVANVAAALYDAGAITGWAGIGADVWAVIMMLVAAGVALAMLITRRDVAFAAVVVWALVGIYARPFTTPTFAPLATLNTGLVDGAALACAILIALAVVARLALNRPGMGSPALRSS
jgi:hypothetical protein